MNILQRIFVKSKKISDSPQLSETRTVFYPYTINDPGIVYLGNGADSEKYDEIFNIHSVKGHALPEGSGSHIYAAFQSVSDEHEPVYLYNGFNHTLASFAGFFAMKKSDEQWVWYTKNNTWEPCSANMNEKYLFQEGDEVSHLILSERQTVFFQAQWIHKEYKTIVNCGYPMFSNQLMAHAFGAFEGKTYCNTQAAYECGIANGYQYFEVDLSYTSDERLVLCHGWSESNCKHTGFSYSPSFSNMTYRRIMKMKVHGHEIIDARKFYELTQKYPSHLYEIDFHPVTGEAAQKRVRALLNDFNYDKKTLDRLLIQVYSKEMYHAIESVYNFKHYQYLVGKNTDKLDEIITFCINHGICVVALRANLAKPEYVKKIKAAGLYVMCYTLNKNVAFAKKLFESGVDTVCTDYITPALLEADTELFGKHPFYVYYNSGFKNPSEEYTPYIEDGSLDGIIKQVPSGSLEYQDTSLWKNDGCRHLVPNHFSVQDHTFAGWKLRVSVDGKTLWYCNDHCYHTGGDITPSSDVQPYLFKDEDVIPVWTVLKEMKLVMVAVWEK